LEQTTIRKVLYALLTVAAFLVVNQVLGSQETTAGGSTPQTAIATASNTGTLEVRLSSSPPGEDVESAVITISNVEVLLTDGWAKLTPRGANTVDLKQVEGLEQTVASIPLGQGTYTQIRLNLTRADIALKGDSPRKANLATSELPFKQNFQVGYKNTTVLVVSFDLMKSISAGVNGQITFDPNTRLYYTKTPGSMELATSALPQGRVGVAYSASLMAIGGQRPYTWSIWNGSLPAGLSLDPATGIISGIPASAGTFYIQFRADDSSPVMKSTIRYATLGAVVVTGNPDLSLQILP
jgi:hypothetical protein